MDNLARSACGFEDSNHTTSTFNWLLNHSWDKHFLDPGFAYKCYVSTSTTKVRNI